MSWLFTCFHPWVFHFLNISFLRQLLCIDVLVGGGFVDFASRCRTLPLLAEDEDEDIINGWKYTDIVMINTDFGAGPSRDQILAQKTVALILCKARHWTCSLSGSRSLPHTYNFWSNSSLELSWPNFQLIYPSYLLICVSKVTSRIFNCHRSHIPSKEVATGLCSASHRRILFSNIFACGLLIKWWKKNR